MPRPGHRQVYLELDEDTIGRLDRRCERAGISRGDALRAAVELFLRPLEPTMTAPGRRWRTEPVREAAPAPEGVEGPAPLDERPAGGGLWGEAQSGW